MEQGGIGNWIAQGVIGAFVLLLVLLFVRTALMVGSVVLLSLARRRRTPPDAGER